MTADIMTGQWLERDGEAVADEVCQEIKWLIDTHLEKIAGDGWETLFRDRRDGRLWERTYPMGEMHGGGPPRLARVSREQAEKRYGALPA